MSTLIGDLVSLGTVIGPDIHGDKEVRFLREKLFNQASRGFAKWMLRAPAWPCRAAITFHHFEDGSDIFGNRWTDVESNTPSTGGPQHPVSVSPGVAFRADAENESYGWDDQAFHQECRNLELELDCGDYHGVGAKIYSFDLA